MAALSASEPTPPAPTGPGLRIGIIAPPWFELPPRGYGGTEAVVADLVNQLELRGHEVTLIASGPPRTRARHYVQVYPVPPSHLLGSSAMPEVIAAAEAARALAKADVDIVHDHSLAGPLLARSRQVPTIATMHGPATGENGEYFRRLGATVGIVGISDAQTASAPDLNWIGRVHNGIDVDSYPYQAAKDDYLLWIGRFDPCKGAHLAIAAAQASGRRLVLAGKMNEGAERAYFEAAVAPGLGRGIEYVGEADSDLKRELYAGAACLLFPVQWHEPFGMVMIEAMACGTPVVSTRYGSVPELITQDVTGCIVDHPADLPAAIERSSGIDPAACRDHAEKHFDLSVMAAQYERTYRQVIDLAEA